MGASAARKSKRLLDGTTKPEDASCSKPPSSAGPSTNDKPIDATSSQPSDDKNVRFIAFVGNLPYSATKESLEMHFKSVEPVSIRLITDKEDPQKSKGFAFLEFAKYDRMKFCLEKMHHSVFNDGISEPRKINIELTAGGGGKTRHRQKKLLEKNKKLNEQRRRKFESEMTEKNEKHAKRAAESTTDTTTDTHGLHPSRRRRIG